MEDRYEELMKEEFAPVYKTDASVNRTILEREKAVSMKIIGSRHIENGRLQP